MIVGRRGTRGFGIVRAKEKKRFPLASGRGKSLSRRTERGRKPASSGKLEGSQTTTSELSATSLPY